ncbi:MAG: YceI family protein [Ignavibacteria bacterium]|nr:YceI family protein [Ignavibacteria bacterium]
MRSIIRGAVVSILLIVGCGVILADSFKIDRGHSTIGFSIRHIFSTVHGRFTRFSGTIEYDSNAIEKFSMELEVQDSSINTDNEGRDQDLRDTSFFFVNSFPTSTFKSTKAYKTDKGTFVEGKLTIRGVTKDITVPFEVLGLGGSGDRVVAGFHATFVIDRKDFGVTWNRKLDMGGMLLGDDVTMNIDIEARKAKQ